MKLPTGLRRRVRSGLLRPGERLTELHCLLLARGLRRLPEHATLPHFLGIGSQKAGTTWLFSNLAAHPDVFVPDPPNVQFFSRNLHRGVTWYADHFRDAGGRLAGESSPAYAVLPPRRMRAVHRLIPEARLLFMVRNPVDRAWSHAVMTLATSRGRPADQVPEAEYLGHLRSAASLSRGNASLVIDAWRSVVPSEQLWVGVFDHIRTQPRQLLTSALHHIGVRGAIPWEALPWARTINAGTRFPLPAHLRELLVELYRPELRRLRERIDPSGVAWLEFA